MFSRIFIAAVCSQSMASASTPPCPNCVGSAMKASSVAVNPERQSSLRAVSEHSPATNKPTSLRQSSTAATPVTPERRPSSTSKPSVHEEELQPTAFPDSVIDEETMADPNGPQPSARQSSVRRSTVADPDDQQPTTRRSSVRRSTVADPNGQQPTTRRSSVRQSTVADPPEEPTARPSSEPQLSDGQLSQLAQAVEAGSDELFEAFFNHLKDSNLYREKLLESKLAKSSNEYEAAPNDGKASIVQTAIAYIDALIEKASVVISELTKELIIEVGEIDGLLKTEDLTAEEQRHLKRLDELKSNFLQGKEEVARTSVDAVSKIDKASSVINAAEAEVNAANEIRRMSSKMESGETPSGTDINNVRNTIQQSIRASSLVQTPEVTCKQLQAVCTITYNDALIPDNTQLYAAYKELSTQ